MSSRVLATLTPVPPRLEGNNTVTVWPSLRTEYAHLVALWYGCIAYTAALGACLGSSGAMNVIKLANPQLTLNALESFVQTYHKAVIGGVVISCHAHSCTHR